MIGLDLFAGTGWGVACRSLGIEEHGVELMPEAVATREANGMITAYRDVWDGLDNPEIVPEHDLLIASPPCQTFSMAGSGSGRKALDEVLGLLEDGAYQHPHEMRAFGDRHDPRTALVLTPLSYVARWMPTYVVFEQVPPVMPVWDAMAHQLRGNGYSVTTGVLNAEQYGVPQTRKRALLIARRDGLSAQMPTPTHSRYYSRTPERVDLGVRPWVSMASALGVGTTDVVISNYGTGGDPAMRGERTGSQPSATVTSKAGRNRWLFNDQSGTPFDPDWPSKRPATTLPAARGFVQNPGATANRFNGSTKSRNDGIHVTVEQAAILQSYPPEITFVGRREKVFQQIGNAVPPLLAEAVLRTLVEPPLP